MGCSRLQSRGGRPSGSKQIDEAQGVIGRMRAEASRPLRQAWLGDPRQTLDLDLRQTDLAEFCKDVRNLGCGL